MTEPMSPSVCRNAMEDRAHRQRCRDRQGQIIRLTARRGSGFCSPRRDSLLREPNDQTASLTQYCVIVRRVGNPVARLRDMMTVFGVEFERHGRLSVANEGSACSGGTLAGNSGGSMQHRASITCDGAKKPRN
jgi:hypothetical protein